MATIIPAQYPRVYRSCRWLSVVEPAAPMTLTRRFEVRAKKGDLLIGSIRWYGPFRCYSFLPLEGTVYEVDCLGDIIDTLNQLNREHKAKRE